MTAGEETQETTETRPIWVPFRVVSGFLACLCLKTETLVRETPSDVSPWWWPDGKGNRCQSHELAPPSRPLAAMFAGYIPASSTVTLSRREAAGFVIC